MSKDDRDQRGGHRGQWLIAAKGHSEFTRRIRRDQRNRAKRDLKAAHLRGHYDHEPQPKYNGYREYWD